MALCDHLKLHFTSLVHWCESWIWSGDLFQIVLLLFIIILAVLEYVGVEFMLQYCCSKTLLCFMFRARNDWRDWNENINFNCIGKVPIKRRIFHWWHGILGHILKRKSNKGCCPYIDHICKSSEKSIKFIENTENLPRAKNIRESALFPFKNNLMVSFQVDSHELMVSISRCAL